MDIKACVVCFLRILLTTPCAGENDESVLSFGYEFNEIVPKDLTAADDPETHDFQKDDRPLNPFCVTTNYCVNHTMCINQENPDGCDREIVSKGCSPETKMYILYEHNYLRNKLALGRLQRFPTAKDMQKLAWNNRMEIFAQRWTDQCIHTKMESTRDHCRNTRQYFVKQLVYSIKTYENESRLEPAQRQIQAWGNVIKEWIDGHKKFPMEYINQFTFEDHDRPYEPFAHIAFAPFKFVGCGYIHFKKEDIHHEVFVCNYGPWKLEKNITLYVQGQPCTYCEINQRCTNKFPALCESAGKQPLSSKLWTIILISVTSYNY